MSSILLSTGDLYQLTGAFYSLFLTETQNRTVTVFKEPQKKIAQSNPSNNLYGYGDASTPTNFVYSPVTGVFPAIVLFEDLQGQNQFTDIHVRVPASEAKIKVEKAARDFIINRKTEYILIDDQKFNVTQEDSTQFYYGLKFYYIGLQRTK